MSRLLSKSVGTIERAETLPIEFCSSGLIAKRAVAVVSKKKITVTGDQYVEIAIVIDVCESC